MKPFDVAAPGTPEAVWSGWLAAHPLPVLEMERIRRLVVVAPHPDDETLGAGGLIHRCCQARREVVVVEVTDGDAADPLAGTTARDRLARRRRAEQREAVGRLGVEAGRLHHLGFGDGDLPAHVEEIVRGLTPLLDEATTVAVTLGADGHPDHAATADAARQAAAKARCALLEYPIWAWHWAGPGDAGLPWARGRSLPLDDLTRSVKRRAVDAYPSQTDDAVGGGPILPPHVLGRLLRPVEVFFSSSVAA